MNFKKEDYLSVSEIKKLIKSDYPHDKATLICNKLKKYCFVTEDTLFELQDNFTYDILGNTKNFIVNKVSYLIQVSHKNLSNTDKENIELKYPKVCKAIFKNSNIETYYPQLLAQLTRTNVVFNITVGELHFNNGYMDTKTKTFKQRTFDSHCITKYIQRDYVPSSQKQRNKVLESIKKVYPNQEDLDCILSYLGSALSWKGTQDQMALFLLGLGSSGKSFIMALTKAVMGCYFVELGSDTFAGTGGNINKVLNTYKADPQILISWVNEPVDKKMNGSLFKIWVDGNLQSTMLYKDGQFNFTHHSRCITTANIMPTIIVESGTTRRIISYTHMSDFTSDKNKVDASKHIYLLEKDIVSQMAEKGLLDAWFDILVDYCYDWLNGKKPVYGNNFKETKEALITSSDIFQDFIDAKLVITGNKADKIGKDKMREMFLEMYKDKHMNVNQIVTSLKEKSMPYNSDMRSTGNIRGCFYGVKIRSADQDEEDKEDLLVLAARKYAELEAKYNELLNERKYVAPSWTDKTISQNIFKKSKPVEDEEDEKPVKVKKSKKIKKVVESDDEDDDLENFVSGFM